MDSWKLVICLSVSLSRLTSFTHCARSWGWERGEPGPPPTWPETGGQPPAAAGRRMSLSPRATLRITLGGQVCPRAVEAGVARGYDRAWMVLTDLNAYVSVCPRHPCV